MARAILARARFILTSFVVFASLIPLGSAESRCPADLSAAAPADRKMQIKAFQQALTSSPFYKELSRREGKPLTCKVALDEGSVQLSYSFRGKASLEAQVNVGSESTDQRMTVRSIPVKDAMALLKRAEKAAFGKDGCGIVWDKPAEEVAGKQAGSREVVYRGDACNCQARLVYAGKVVVGLIVRNAC